MYDPFQHAEELGVSIVYRRLHSGRGLWVPEARTVFLQQRMGAVHERNTLAHELGHAVLGHSGTSEKYELQADRFAARNLISRERVLWLAQERSDVAAWASDLGVSEYLLTLWLRENRSA
ncbi:hypothetical protein GCM10022198_14770 [Klugiella xanthotipulae]|uniref:Uncharacterized protein DUF955 n=1 Tax=Klugiella xanthotipulae TaxID=244735 RepID=A0A543I6Q6_9MICO|nr:ImmA/IrrE family metallo-endopeptidase [Klugiella xanthotipulae]TQM66231.1 uncharacterized protein DUF955 [Klugiella xanthotipulae]